MNMPCLFPKLLAGSGVPVIVDGYGKIMSNAGHGEKDCVFVMFPAKIRVITNPNNNSAK